MSRIKKTVKVFLILSQLASLPALALGYMAYNRPNPPTAQLIDMSIEKVEKEEVKESQFATDSEEYAIAIKSRGENLHLIFFEHLKIGKKNFSNGTHCYFYNSCYNSAWDKEYVDITNGSYTKTFSMSKDYLITKEIRQSFDKKPYNSYVNYFHVKTQQPITGATVDRYYKIEEGTANLIQVEESEFKKIRKILIDNGNIFEDKRKEKVVTTIEGELF